MLVGAAQIGVLEFHVWGSRIDDVERPDRLVFDLDPSEELGFAEVKQAARDIEGRARRARSEMLPAPDRRQGHPCGRAARTGSRMADRQAVASRRLAKRMAEEDPDRFVATMSKARRKGRIFIDYLRNERGSSAIAPYSPRARKGAPLAWPVDWQDLDGIERANQFGLKQADPSAATAWGDYFETRQHLKKASLDAFGIS